MQKISFVKIALSTLLMLAQSTLVASLGEPATPDVIKNVVLTTFNATEALRNQLREKKGLDTDEQLQDYMEKLFSKFSIVEAYDAVKTEDEFQELSNDQKKAKIWQKIDSDMFEAAKTEFQGIKGLRDTIIMRMISNITSTKFHKDWNSGEWDKIISTVSSNPDSVPASPKTPGDDDGKKKHTPKSPKPTGTKKTSKLTEYRKTIVAGIAFVGISAWLYSKYNRVETQNSMNAGTAA